MATLAEIWKTLSAIDCGAHTEKKQGMTYLSWAWAWGIMMSEFPDCHYQFGDHEVLPDGTMLVNCAVTISGHTREMWLPVMTGGNKPVANPNSFQLNTAKMRCLTKCFGMFGLGHYIYAGEDLPQGSEDDAKKEADGMWKTALASVKNSETMDDLKKHYNAAKSLASSENELAELVFEKDKRKAELSI